MTKASPLIPSRPSTTHFGVSRLMECHYAGKEFIPALHRRAQFRESFVPNMPQ